MLAALSEHRMPALARDPRRGHIMQKQQAGTVVLSLTVVIHASTTSTSINKLTGEIMACVSPEHPAPPGKGIHAGVHHHGPKSKQARQSHPHNLRLQADGASPPTRSHRVNQNPHACAGSIGMGWPGGHSSGHCYCGRGSPIKDRQSRGGGEGG